MTYVGDGELSGVIARGDDAPVSTLGGMSAKVLAGTALTDGRYSLYRIELAPDGGGALPHFHRTFAESFHVLAGTIELYDGAGWVEAGPDDHLYVPPGGVHGFRNASREPVTMLMMSTPGVRREDYFAELLEVARSGRHLSLDEVTEMFARHDQYMVEERSAPTDQIRARS